MTTRRARSGPGGRGPRLTLYPARLYAFRDEREPFNNALRPVLEAEGDNPYYRWVAGGS